MTYRQILNWGSAYLAAAGIIDAGNDSWLLLQFTAGISRTQYFMRMTDPFPDRLQTVYEELIKKRAAHIPLQHITGEQDFMGLPFLVSPDVLIPRQDTETLVEEAQKMLRPKMSILDMCTGSGCILVSLLHYCKESFTGSLSVSGTGADLSEKALLIAEKNAERNQVAAEFIHSDLFTNIHGRFDMIVSNPPYIPTADIENLMPEVAAHEPFMALDGKEDGLYFYRKISRECKEHLTEEGKLLLEIGYDQGKDVSEMLIYEGFKNVRVIRDLAHNDRVVIGEL